MQQREVLCRPKDLMAELMHWQIKVGICADEHLRSLSPEAATSKQGDVTRLVELLIIDEAERLTPTALELLRDQHDRTHFAMILIGTRCSRRRVTRPFWLTSVRPPHRIGDWGAPP